MQKTPPTSSKELQEKIISATAQYYGIEVEKYKLNTRKAVDNETAYRKHVCYFMLRQYTFLSYDSIALIFDTGQSTIKCGVNKINDLLTYNRRTIADVMLIRKVIDNFKENLKG